MKILTKSDEKFEMLRNQISEKDALIASLQNKLIELEADSLKKQQILSNELSKEKLRNQETIFNMSLKNSEMIQEIQDQLIQKKQKIIYYEGKVDGLKKLQHDIDTERKLDKELIQGFKFRIAQQDLENGDLLLSVKAFQDDIQQRNLQDSALNNT